MFKVLIVDDNFADAEGLKNYIDWDNIGCTVVGSAINGMDGYEKSLALKPEIIITDISMPVIDGMEMTSMIQEKLPNILFIFISCFPSFDYTYNAIKNNIFDYVLKPIDIDEITSVLKKAVDSLNSRNETKELRQKLSEQFEQNKDILFEHHIYNILCGEKYDRSIMELFGINADLPRRIIICNIENGETQNALNPIFQKLNLKNIFGSHFENCICVNSTQMQYIIIVNASDINSQLSELQKIQNELSLNGGGNVSFYVGEKECNFENIGSYFTKLMDASKDNFFISQEQIMLIDDEMLNFAHSAQPVNISEIMSDIYAIFDIDASLDDFIEKYYSSSKISNQQYLKSISYYIISFLNIYLIEQNKSFSNVFDSDTAIWIKLSQFKSIASISCWIRNIITATKEYLSSQSEDYRYRKIVSSTKNYIMKHYSSSDALTESADSQNISLNYANLIFKKYENKTIFDYLVEVRINEAKKLLSETTMKIFQISAAVGYSSNTYFSTSFRKVTGMTPQQYRDNTKGGEISIG